MKKKLLLVILIGLLLGCNSGGGGSSSDGPPTVEITGWIMENVDESVASKYGSNANATAYFSIWLEVDDPDGIDDIVYVEIANPDDRYWILRDKNSGIDLYDPEYKDFFANLLYSSDSPNTITLGQYAAFVQDSEGNQATTTINFSSPGTALPEEGFIYSEDYLGSTVGGIKMLKRASVTNFIKGENSIVVEFQVDDARVYNGYIWLYNGSPEYITWSGYFKNTINSGSGILNDGTTNTLQIQSSDLELGFYSWDDINGFHIVLTDGTQYSPDDNWDHRSISQYASFTSSQINLSLLEYRVIDAEYSMQLDKIIMISENPDQLHIFDPITEENTSVDLPLTPTCVSISPDGIYAAVGHNAWISYIDLPTTTLEKTIAVSTNAIDIVLAGNGYVYAFPRADQWERIRCINIATEVETQSTGSYIRAGTLAKLHPNGEAIYGADNGLSPSNIEKYNIVNGTAEYLYDSPYHGDFSMCGDLWISEDGLRIFTRCGNVFRSSNVETGDMTHYGSLSELSWIEHMSNSLAANKVIAITQSQHNGITNNTIIQIYAYDSLFFEKSIELPYLYVDNKTYPGNGKFLFISSDGSKYFVILQADESSGVINYSFSDL